MMMKTAKFSIGQVVKHRLFPFRGVIFDVDTDSIAIQRYVDWDYTQSAITRSVVDGYLNAQAMTVSFDTSANGKRAPGPRQVLGAHKRRRHWN